MTYQRNYNVSKIFETFSANIEPVKKHWRLENLSLVGAVAISGLIFAAVLATAP